MIHRLLLLASFGLAAGCSATSEMCRVGSVPPLQPSAMLRAPEQQQRIERALAARVGLDVPARVLVMSTDTARGWSGDATLVEALAGALERSAYFVPVAAMTTPLAAPQDAQHPLLAADNACELAAREGAPYLLLCGASYTTTKGWNPLRLLYAGLVTMLFVPGETVATEATIEAALIDVRTGIIILRASVHDSESSRFVDLGETSEERNDQQKMLAKRAAGPLGERIEALTRRELMREGVAFPRAEGHNGDRPEPASNAQKDGAGQS